MKLGCNTNIIFYGEPEAVTSLEGRGGGRHHDLLLVQENEVVVGVEAKSDEDFGKFVCKELFGNKDYKELFEMCIRDSLHIFLNEQFEVLN